jgi:hypothetical protein
MSRLVRVLVASSVLVVLSLGSTAHAQDAEAPSQPAGVTQPAPTPDPPAENPPAENPPAQDPPAQDPPAQDPPAQDPPAQDPPAQDPPAQDPGTTTTTTTTTRPPVARPKSLPVTVSPQAAVPGTTVTVRADLLGCLRPDSGSGFFQDAEGRDVDGLAKWLDSEGVSGGRWYTGRYRIAKDDAAGLGQFGVVCDKSIVGFANFRVLPSRSPVPVRVTPQAAGRGTTVKVTAEVGWCQRIHIWFYDSKSEGLTEAGGAKRIEPNLPVEAGTVTASYTLTRKDAIGPARFTVVCGTDIDHARVGETSFRVLGSGGGSGGDDPTGNDRTQLPKRIDTGLGPTADGGIDPVWLLLPAGLLLIALAAALRLRQATTRRR